MENQGLPHKRKILLQELNEPPRKRKRAVTVKPPDNDKSTDTANTQKRKLGIFIWNYESQPKRRRLISSVIDIDGTHPILRAHTCSEQPEEKEDDEEEDIDLMMDITSQLQPQSTNDNYGGESNKNRNELKTFGIGNILSNIASNLSIVEIIKLRGVNQLFNNELEFGFECHNFRIHFYYNNKYIIDIINNEYCNTLDNLTLFYLQSFNVKKSSFALKKGINPGNTSIPVSGLTRKYILHITTQNEFPDHVKPCPHFDFNVDFDVFCKYGNVKMNPFKSLYFEMKLINDRIKKCDLFGNDTIDMLQLCRHYQFKPLRNKLQQLMSGNTKFRDFIHIKERDRVADGWLSYIWHKVGFGEQLFSWYWDMRGARCGKPALFADSAAFGNFDIYDEFLKSLNGNVTKLRQFSLSNESIFGMFAVFLRRDLAMNYIHHETVFFHGPETLAYVIQPQLLLEYKKSLVHNCMFVLNDENEREFDLIKNERYHPNERIKFLKMLTNSTTFAQGLLHHIHKERSTIYIELANIMDRLLQSFDNFKTDWMLDEYDDLNGNIGKQKEIYEIFKYHLQFLFGISVYFVDTTKAGSAGRFTSRYKTITEANTNGICDAAGLNIGTPIENGFKFIDLSDDMIKCDKDLKLFVDTLIKSCQNWQMEDLLDNLEYPAHNGHLNRWDEETGEDVIIPELEFASVSDIYKFLQIKWNYK